MFCTFMVSGWASRFGGSVLLVLPCSDERHWLQERADRVSDSSWQ